MAESYSLSNWTFTRTEPVELPHGKSIPTSIRGFMWARELVHLNQVAWELKEMGVPGDVLEIGSYCGLSACALAQPGPLTCIDTFTDSWGPSENERYTRPEFDANMKLMGLEPLVLECESKSALEWLRKTPRRFRFILVDAGHSYADALADITGSIPLLSPKGLMAIDDKNFPGVSEAARDAGLELHEAKGGKLTFGVPK